jgi:hypothetical protein
MSNTFGDEILTRIFGKGGSGIGRLPNIVASDGPFTTSIVLNSLGEAAGVWGIEPPYDENGMQKPRLRSYVEDFRLWAVPENQAVLAKVFGTPRSETFTCVMPQSVPDQILRHLLNAAIRNGAIYLENTWDELVRLLPQIRWFLAPVGEYVPLAVFCALDQLVADYVKTELRAAGEPTTNIEFTAQGETWESLDLGNELRDRCGFKG